MNEKIANELAGKINNTYGAQICASIFKNLGVCINFRAVPTCALGGEYYVEFFTRAGGMDVTDELTGNQLLRRIFKSGYLYASALYFQTEQKILVRVGVRYKHPDGGSNGLNDLLNITINDKTGQIEKED